MNYLLHHFYQQIPEKTFFKSFFKIQVEERLEQRSFFTFFTFFKAFFTPPACGRWSSVVPPRPVPL